MYVWNLLSMSTDWKRREIDTVRKNSLSPRTMKKNHFFAAY